MLQVGPQQRVLVAVRPVDFRKGIDGLAALCRQHLDSDPFSGILFLFTNRRRTAIKLLCYDGQGFWLCQKRFSKGRLTWWPVESESPQGELAARQLQILLWNGHPEGAKLAPLWRPLAATPSRKSSAVDNSREATTRARP